MDPTRAKARANRLAVWSVVEFPSRARSEFGRRDLLRLAARTPAAVALTPVAASLATSCSAGADDGPDQLKALATAAESDEALARAIARAHSGLAGSASTIATTRAEHARALQREIDRVSPPDPEAPEPAKPRPPQAPASPGEASAAMSTALRSAQQKAAELVPALPAYRAGLTGSISASCASMLEVLA